MKRYCLHVLIIASLTTGAATAELVSYSVGGWFQQFPGPVTPPPNAPWGPNGYPGDTVEFDSYTGTLDLTPGSYTQKINTLLWTIDYTYGGTETDPNDWSNLAFNFNALRTISFDGGPSGSVGQGGLLEVTWDNDYLSLDDGPMVSFIVGGYRVDITPLGLERVGGTYFDGGNPWRQPDQDVMARFDVSALTVPAPESSVLGLIGIGVAAIVRRRVG